MRPGVWAKPPLAMLKVAVALALSPALLVSMPALAATPAGTVIGHSFTARFGSSTPQKTVTSNQTAVTVQDLADPLLTPARTLAAAAGKPCDFLHTVTNRGNSTDSFQLFAVILGAAGSNVSPTIQFLAADGSAPLPVDAGGVALLGPIAPGASLSLLLRVTPPAGSEGRVVNLALKAVSTLVPGRSASLSDQLVVPNATGLAAPVLSVTPAGAVLPGTLLTYGILLENPGPAPVTGVLVADRLDALLEFQPGTALFPAGLTGATAYDPAGRTLSFTIAGVPAGFTGSVSFQARVAAGAAANSAIANSASLASDTGADPVLSNATLTPVLGPALLVSKQAGSATAEAGDLVSFSVQVQNTGAAALSHLTLADTLPRGFRYLKGTSTVDGARSADPAGAGGQLSWDTGTLAAAGSRTLSYRCVVNADVPVGTSVNWVTATGQPPTGGMSVSTPASASVKVRSSILGDKAVILGRVFEDANGNGVPDPGERGVAGVRIYLEDGSYVFTDPEGQYSFTGVSAGNHVVKIDRTTLAPRYRPVAYNTAFAGVGWSQFITVPFGGPARGDFALALAEQDAVTPAAGEQPAGAPAQAGSAPPPAAAAPAATKLPVAPPPAAGPGPGPATSLRVTPERLDMPADGSTVVPFTVELLNREGKRVAGKGQVTVAIGKGILVEPDADPKTPGHQVSVRDGLGVFRVRSPRAGGQDRIVVTGENGLSGRVDLFFSEQLRDWIVVGLCNLTAGGRGVSGHLEKIGQDERFEKGIYHDERLAFFTRGKILGKYLLTAAYDSGKERRDGVFQAIDPEKYYPVYGDASDTGYGAQSQGKLYLKLEAGRSYLLAGDYRTDLSENEFSRYDRALNGVKGELNGQRLSLKGFESRTQQNLVKDEIPGNGTSGFYSLSQKPVFENSERVRIEVRDRYHSERVLSVAEKLRFADYSIDYNAGTILFKEPIPSLDQYLNPVTIVVNYQSQGGGEHYVYGGRAQVTSANGSHLGGTTVVEQGTAKDRTLYGVDGELRLSSGLNLKGEGALSDTPEMGRGSAWKAELNAKLAEGFDAGGYYRRVERSFFNSSMTGNEVGTEKFGGRLDYRALPGTLLFAESFVQRDELTGNRQFGNQAGFSRKFSLFEGEGGVKHVDQYKDGVEGRSDLLYAGIRGPLTKRLDVTLRREQLLSPSNVAEYQSKSFLKLDYRITDRTSAFLTEEYQEGSPLMRQATRLGLESRLSGKMRLTTGYQLANGAAGSSDHGNVDLNTKLIDRDGLNLNSRTGYQLENALSQQRGEAILGLNSRYRAAEGLYLDSTLERVQTVQGNSGTRTAFTLAGEYLRVKEMKLTGRYEIRTGPGEDASLYQAALGYKLNPSLTLIGKAIYSDRDLPAGRDRLFDGYLGSSFRPLAGNPLQLLTLVRYKLDDRGSNPALGASRSFILSAEPNYRLVKDLSVQGKYAGKFNWLNAGGLASASYSDLLLAGLSYDLAERWELSAYLKFLNQYETGQHVIGSVARVGFRVYRNVVVSAGYNFARLDDRDLTGESFQGSGPFFGVKMKFDEEMFGTEKKAAAPQPQVSAEVPQAPARPPLVPALLVSASRVDEPLRLSGSAELLTLLINGEPVRLPLTAVSVGRSQSVSQKAGNGETAAPLEFLVKVAKPEQAASWSLKVVDAHGGAVADFSGAGAPAARIAWPKGKGGTVKPGEIYQYQLEVRYRDGSQVGSPVELFGVDRQDTVLLTLGGGAFLFDSARLTAEGKRLLKRAARALRAYPREKVVVEGHTDDVGTVGYNMKLSKKRCDAAADYLEQEEKIPASRLVRRWYGKSRPMVDNSSEEGRRLNRRVELKGNFQKTRPVTPDDRYRGAPFLRLNGRTVPVDGLGRFDTVQPAGSDRLLVEMGDSLGRTLAAELPLPTLRLERPAGQRLVHFGSSGFGIGVDEKGRATCTLAGQTAPGGVLEVEGRRVPLDAAGRFSQELPLPAGERVIGMVLRNYGCAQLLNLKVLSAPQTADRVQP